MARRPTKSESVLREKTIATAATAKGYEAPASLQRSRRRQRPRKDTEHAYSLSYLFATGLARHVSRPLHQPMWPMFRARAADVTQEQRHSTPMSTLDSEYLKASVGAVLAAGIAETVAEQPGGSGRLPRAVPPQVGRRREVGQGARGRAEDGRGGDGGGGGGGGGGGEGGDR